MSSIEKLFVQIFERKRSIIEQAKRQTIDLDKHLASKLIIDGYTPPSWLVPPPLHAHSSDPNQFNKEEFISRVSRPQPVIPYSSSRCSLYNKPVVTGDNWETQNGFLKEVCASDTGLDVGDGRLFLPECHAGCASSGGPELDPSGISSRDLREKGISDAYNDPALSLERVQRSKSRQRGLEVRNSAKAVESCSRDKNVVATFAGGISGSGIASLQCGPVDELDHSAISPQDPGEKGILDTYHDPALSLARVSRSKSRQRALEVRNSAKAVESCPRDENIVSTFAGGISGSAIASLQSDPVDELVFVNPVDTNNVSCVVEEVKIGDCRSKEDGSNIFTGRLTRSRSSSQQVSSFNEGKSSYNAREPSELAKPSRITDGSCGGRKAKIGDNWSEDMRSNVYHGRLTRSRSSSQQPNCVNKLMKLDSSYDKVGGVSHSKQHSNYVDDSKELVKSSAIIDDSCGVKEEVVDCDSKEQGSNAYFGRILKYRSSSPPFNNVNSTQAQSIGKSTQPPQSPRCVGGDAALQSEEGPQMYDVISLPSQQDQELCRKGDAREHSSKANSEVEYVSRNSESLATNKVNAAYYSDKENVADEYAGNNLRGETTSTIEGISKPVNSSNALGCRVTRSRSNAFNKPPLAQSLKRSEGIDLKEVSGTQIKVLPCISTSDTVGLERCASTAAEFEIVSDELVAACSGCPGSNLDVASLRVGLEVLASRPPSDCDVFMKPKQLNFDYVEESSLNRVSSPASEKELQGRSPERSPLTLSDPADIMEKVASVSYQANCNSSPEKSLLEEQEDLSKESELQRFSSDVHVEKTDEASRSSNGNTVSPVKDSPEVPKDAVMHTLLETDRISKEKSSLIDHLSISQFAREDLLELPKQVGYILSNDRADTRMDVSIEKVVVDHDGGQTTKLVTEDSKLDSDLCSDLKQSTDAGFAIVSGSGPFKNPDVTLRDSIVELPCAVWVEETRGNLVQQTINSGISQCQNEASLGRCTIEDKLVYCPKSMEEQILKNSMPSGSFSLGLEDSWPQHKRRKIEGQLTEVLSASPSLREEGRKLINRDSVSENLNGVEDKLKAVLESQHFSLSHEEGVAQSDVSKSPVEEMHQNEEGRMIEESEASLRLQVEEVERSLEGTGGNKPFTFMDDGLRLSYISSLIDQAASDSQGCLAEEAGVADPNTSIFDARMRCFVDENQVPFHLEDKLRLGITEHFASSERMMQEKRSNLEGNEKFSYCSVGTPHSQSLDLTGADEIMPVFEGFVMQSDEKQPCIAEEGIGFDKFDLPNTAIEHDSSLEQPCRVAFMNTPFSCSSTSHKLHRIPSLYQSVPNGLLEGMNGTGKELHNSCLSGDFPGRSYSDCLPNSSGQSAWDIRNPYSSPVGKLWDRITSNNGSLEKQVSLNPELPCIDEENEIADEVAETFPEGICSEVTTSSVKRVPLADITENPNQPASVSEVEIYADRCSLDSVNTEFSFTGTHTRVKQKHGNQNSTKRRYARKAKENQSVSIGANGVKRATESFHNRLSKTKLSEKPSMRKGGPSVSERESKTNNIVSNITSFIPLVQQKQAAAVVTGKRDIKVKALEAAEAAKRLAEKKDNERKMKKEALKVKRARLEQENLRQLELQKRRKAVEQKKKEADMAAKKRQREEEERTEKERKRKRVEVSHRQQREHEEKLRAEKELKCRATETRTHESKESKVEADKHKNLEKDREDNLGKVSETEPTRIPTSDTRQASILHAGNDAKVTSNLDIEVENDNSVANTNQEQSYDISPYKVSDDEDEDDDDDDDDVPNKKLIPSWASKHCVFQIVSSQKTVDPESIFPPESFCNIDKVLLPRKLQVK